MAAGLVRGAGHCGVTRGIQQEAMTFFSDTHEIASRFADSIADLHDVFRCHGVDFGAPQDFLAFARTLRYHSELRGDVLRVVKSVMESGTDVSFRTILTVIAVASGGPDVAMPEREMSVPVKQVIESLIGVGAWSQPNADGPELYSSSTGKRTKPAAALEMDWPDGRATGEAMAETEGNGVTPIPVAEESWSGGVEAAGTADVSGGAGVAGGAFARVADDSAVDFSSASSIDEGLSSLPSAPNSDGSGPRDGQGLLNDVGGSKTAAESIPAESMPAESMPAESTLAETLTRLELNSLQLKIYLDSIDQRISRMEPRLEKVAPLVLSAAQARAREESAAPRFSAAIASEDAAVPFGQDSPPRRNEADVSNQRGGAATAHGAGKGPLAVRAPASTRSRQFKVEHIRFAGRQIALPIFVGVAMLLLAASLFWRFGRPTAPVAILPGNASVDGGGNTAGASASPRTPSVLSPQVSGSQVGGSNVSGPAEAASVRAGHVAPAGERSAMVSGTQRENSVPAETVQGEGGAAGDRPASPSKRSAQIPLRTPLRPSSTVAAPLMAKGTAEVADSSDGSSQGSSESAEDEGSVPLSNRLVNVSSGVMAANLVSAPKPSYPTLANLTRTQGNVVMQAVIAKDGTVEEVHVIKGHRLLRNAAKNAVRSWRYLPYKVDGVPVEVTTTVSVDFSLHH